MYLFGAVKPGTDEAFAWIMPEVSTKVMQIFLDEFAKTIPADEHAVMVADQASWHTTPDLKIPDNVTMVPLPPYSPQLNPPERVWEYLKEKFLSFRLLDDYDAIVEATAIAWNRLRGEAGRLTTLTGYPWINPVET